MIPFYLVTGFLGSGKTTLLKSILREYAATRRIAIIQNEFAASGTDGKELELTGSGFRLVEVNNGSVFCVCMLGNFAASVAKVIDEYAPELIFLEASGLSDPINILELLQDESIRSRIHLSRIITIVDGRNFPRAVKMLHRTRHQVMIADDVIINKVDLDPSNGDAVMATVQSINPFASVRKASYCSIDLDEILKEASSHKAAEKSAKRESEGRPAMTASVLRINRTIAEAALLSLVAELQPTCPRIKGYVNTTAGGVVMIQSVFENLEMKAVTGYTGPSEIVAFGEGMMPRRLRDLFLKYV
jgi:G3E family GTPase